MALPHRLCHPLCQPRISVRDRAHNADQQLLRGPKASVAGGSRTPIDAMIRKAHSMPWRRVAGRFVRMVLWMAVFSAMTGPATAGGGDEGRDLRARVEVADLIVVGRVQDVIDDSPGARERRSREAHRVIVEKVLQGPDISGWRLALRPPADFLWALETSYVLFLDQQIVGSERPRVLEGTTRPATADVVARVRRAIAETGGEVLGRPAFWLSVQPGWAPHPRLQVLVLANGDFRWDVRTDGGSLTRRTGKLAEATRNRLVARAKALEREPITDDADIVSVGWVESGQVKRKTIYGGDRKAVEHFLESVTAALADASG